MNNSTSLVYNRLTKNFEKTRWKNIKLGDLVKIEKDQTFPADLLLVCAPNEIIFVDTMNLDGETNLKPKEIAHEMINNDKIILNIKGTIECDLPNASLEEWDALIKFQSPQLGNTSVKIKHLLLRGCYLRNTP